MLDSNPVQNPEALLRMAKELLKQGKAPQAEAALRQALQAQPNNAQAMEYMGAALLARGEAGKASGWLRKAIQTGGGSVIRHNNLGSALFLLNRLQEAVLEYEKTLELEPDNVNALMGVGKCLLQTGDYDRAGGCFQRVEELEPERYDALKGQVDCYYQLEYPGQAADACQRALALRPDDYEMRITHGQLLSELTRHQEAVEELEPLLRYPEWKATARETLIEALIPLNRMKQVEELAREGMNENPRPPGMPITLARALNSLGRSDEARQVLEDAVAGGASGAAWLQLQGLRPLTEDELEQMKEQFRTLPEDAVQLRGALAFAIAEYYEKQKDRSAQMEWLHVGNELVASTRRHDPKQLENYLDALREHLTRETMEALAEGGDPDYRPVFILGLPRSGTTLLEQILGAHSELTATGENPVLPWAFRQEGYPSKLRGVRELTPDLVTRVARNYRQAMEEYYGTDARHVDKGIVNGREAGLLYCMFPNARFIEIRRHPLDVALGCYKQLFAHQNFSFYLEGIGREFKGHEDMMAFWHEQMPVPIHTVQYEELVTAQDEVTKEVLAFLELPFDPACLKFHEQTTQVATASINQVRQGVYSSAVGRWQAYGELLDPLRDALHEQGLTIPGEDDLDPDAAAAESPAGES